MTQARRQRSTVEIPADKAASVRLDGGSEFQFPAGTKKFNGEIAKENEFHKIVRDSHCRCDLTWGYSQPCDWVTIWTTWMLHSAEFNLSI